jgi:predicted nucleic acid-binding protein
MKLFLDANILIDFINNRNNTRDDLATTFTEIGHNNIYISALSIHIAYYILKIKRGSFEHETVSKLIKLLNIVSLDIGIIQESLKIGFNDFEDALQFFSAKKYCDTIITRDVKGFKNLKAITKSDIRLISN